MEYPVKNVVVLCFKFQVVTAIAIYLYENYNSEEKLPKNDPKLRNQVIQVIQVIQWVQYLRKASEEWKNLKFHSNTVIERSILKSIWK
ncbi:hypothetical protein GLOIN_2v1773126 [Rhizophagus irregularis DAOM 181602=DAOM 197198]|uniref:Uncharacterized protein n=1 Tax=Rhizophagus irregularis (strain DAOM 181602 / DAOM 197198 / MUCL 43194) TaxID=747089 RepID=A0A2P4Q5C0_RHIID|nr:hypothetical protein GLOIN_2v1773126 [Rhizophagus irregularis DAOM 181602=DAOM 197198]POG72847.1 hypothetical protein GLOIN_2v1773126 [Rhizophagus irregularis DAOM 181602=DAOM 197198]|eukprot:XP_025179713.1 hypothetical protein GLOIN_2v1773126 [Rhizophagus irregularis DAOM 181602=DAOM 197198]